MPDYQWPDAEHRTLIGKRTLRVDAPDKVSGQARYTYDVKRPGMLFGKMLRAPYAHCKVVSIDTSAAEKMPGVKAIEIVQKAGSTIHWAGDEVVAVAAVDERTAEDAVRAIQVRYQKLAHLVSDAEPPEGAAESQGPLSMEDLGDMLDNQVPERQIVSMIEQYGVSFKATEEDYKDAKEEGVPDSVMDAVRKATVHPEAAGKTSKSNFVKAASQTQGEGEKAFAECDEIAEGLYGAPVITHCCMESHGSTAEWTDADHLFVHMSTQNVSGIAGQMAEPLKIPAANIRVHQDHVGGGFGSKFGPDRWGIVTARLSKKAGGKPVRLMLERDSELKVAGARPSAYARVKIGAKKDGTLVAWQSQSWGTGGPGGGGMPPIPYCFAIPNQRKEHTAIRNNIGPARAWRAPNHPQAAVLTMCALDDLAARLKMDPYDFFLKNIELTRLPQIYKEEFPIAAELMGWKEKWLPRGMNLSGNIARGLGLSLHTWGGARPRQRLRPVDSSRRIGRHQDGHAGHWHRNAHLYRGGGRRCAGTARRGHQALHRRHAVSAVGGVGRLDHSRGRELVDAARGRGCPRRLVRPSGAGACGTAGGTGGKGRHGAGQGRPQAIAELEGSVLEDGRDPNHGPRSQ